MSRVMAIVSNRCEWQDLFGYLSIWFVTVFPFLLLKICRYVLQFKDGGMTPPPALVVVGMYEVGVWLLGSYGYWVNLLGTNHFITESISKKNILCPTYSKKKKNFIFFYVKNSDYCKKSVFQFINSKGEIKICFTQICS